MKSRKTAVTKLGGDLMTFIMSAEVIVKLSRTVMAYFVTLTDDGMCISGQMSINVRDVR